MKKEVKNKEILTSLKESGESTKQIILHKANEIINKAGMVDFRIDTLAASLGLSPGNITYHFPKKEDISNALWELCNREITAATEHYITPLLDVKQLFLFYRFLVGVFYKYKGIVCFRMGDLGVIHKGMNANRIFRNTAKEQFQQNTEYLIKNGYMNKINDPFLAEMTFLLQFMGIGWSINHAVSFYADKKLPKNKGKENEIIANKYAHVILRPLTPFLTEKGKEQLKGISSITQ